MIARRSIVLLAALLAPGCGLLDLLAPSDRCKPVHQLENADTPRNEIERLEKLIRLPVRPTRALWTKGRIRVLQGQTSTLPGGDWELLALLEFTEADAQQLLSEEITDLTELELPGVAWMGKQLGVALTKAPPTNPCEEPKMRISGFRYDGKKFERYFLKVKAFMKMPGSSFYVLWMSTVP